MGHPVKKLLDDQPPEVVKREDHDVGSFVNRVTAYIISHSNDIGQYVTKRSLKGFIHDYVASVSAIDPIVKTKEDDSESETIRDIITHTKLDEMPQDEQNVRINFKTHEIIRDLYNAKNTMPVFYSRKENTKYVCPEYIMDVRVRFVSLQNVLEEQKIRWIKVHADHAGLVLYIQPGTRFFDSLRKFFIACYKYTD